MFNEMQTKLKTISSEGSFENFNLKRGTLKDIMYIQNEKFVLTYTL